MRNDKQMRLFNIYGNYAGYAFGGSVWNVNGISPTIRTQSGGGTIPLIMIAYEAD